MPPAGGRRQRLTGCQTSITFGQSKSQTVLVIGDGFILTRKDNELDQLLVIEKFLQSGPCFIGDHGIKMEFFGGPNNSMVVLIPTRCQRPFDKPLYFLRTHTDSFRDINMGSPLEGCLGQPGYA